MSSPHEEERQAPAWLERLGRSAWHLLGVIAAVTVVVLVAGFLWAIVAPLIVSVFLAIVLFPVVRWLSGRGVPRPVAALLAIVLLVAVLAITVVVVVVGIVDQSDRLGDSLNQAQVEIEALVERWHLDPYVERLRGQVSESSSLIGPGVASGVASAFGSFATFVSGLVLGGVLLYYFLKDGDVLVDRLAARGQPGRREGLERLMTSAGESVRSYFKGRTILAFVQGIAVALALWVLGVPLPFAVGTVNLIGAYIPYLGAFIGGLFAVVMGLSGGGVGLAVAALLVVLFVNLVLENLLEPRLVGSSLSLHPVAVLLATVAGGLTIGMLGLILAAPLTAVAKQTFEDLQRVGYFHGRPPGPSLADPVLPDEVDDSEEPIDAPAVGDGTASEPAARPDVG